MTKKFCFLQRFDISWIYELVNENLAYILTVLQIRENPKINAPGILKYPTEREHNFEH